MSVARMFCSIILIALVTGCSFGGQIAKHAVEYNLAAEDAENQMLFLNVVRAAKRMPMHFTRIDKITGNLEGSISINGRAPLEAGANAANAGFLSPTFGGATKPSFDVEILDSKDFFTGILSPIPTDVFNHYEQQGWPKALLLHTMVEDIAVSYAIGDDAKLKLCHLENRLGFNQKTKSYEAFQHYDGLVRLLSEDFVEFTEDTGDAEAFGPLLDAAAIEDISVIKNLKKDGFGFDLKAGDASMFRLEKAPSNIAFKLSSQRLRNVLYTYRDVVQQNTCREEAFEYLIRYASAENEAARANLAPLGGIDYRSIETAPDDFKVSAVMTLRSAQGVLYYLGELARAQIGKGIAVKTRAFSDAGAALFRIGRHTSPAEINAAISVQHQGEWYSVAKPGFDFQDHSLQLLTLARQLLALNIEAKEFRGTQTVRFIN